MMPAFLIMLLFLVIISQTLPGAKDGLEFIFKPDFSKFNAEMTIVFASPSLKKGVNFGTIVSIHENKSET